MRRRRHRILRIGPARKQAVTASPTATPVTPGPTAATVPAPSNPGRSDAPFGRRIHPAAAAHPAGSPPHRRASPVPVRAPAPARPARRHQNLRPPGALISITRIRLTPASPPVPASRQVHRRHPRRCPQCDSNRFSGAVTGRRNALLLTCALNFSNRITSAIRRAMKSSVACAFRLSSPSQYNTTDAQTPDSVARLVYQFTSSDVSPSARQIAFRRAPCQPRPFRRHMRQREQRHPAPHRLLVGHGIQPPPVSQRPPSRYSASDRSPPLTAATIASSPATW